MTYSELKKELEDADLDDEVLAVIRNRKKLTSLEGIPKKFGVLLDLSSTENLKSLKNGPVSVEGSLYLSNSGITSLDYLPKYIGSNLWLDGTKFSKKEEEVLKAVVKQNITINGDIELGSSKVIPNHVIKKAQEENQKKRLSTFSKFLDL